MHELDDFLGERALQGCSGVGVDLLVGEVFVTK